MENYKGDIHQFGRNNDQYKFAESTYSPDQWKTIDLLAVMQEWQKHSIDLRADMEYCLDLDQSLNKELWALLINHGTVHQIQVATLIYKGFNQNEIARQLKIHQTSVFKTLKGNTSPAGYSSHHGGLKNKLIKLIKSSKPIQTIMKEIYNTDPTCYLPHYSCFKSCFKAGEYLIWLKQEIS